MPKWSVAGLSRCCHTQTPRKGPCYSATRRLQMKKARPKPAALSLALKRIFDPEFVREVLDRKGIEGSTPRGQLLRSSTSATLVRNRIMGSTVKKLGSASQLSDLVLFTPSELKRMAKLGPKTLRWLEEYLHLLGVVLPHSRSVHGMNREAREVLESLR